MNEFKTPDSIIKELIDIRAEAQKGIAAQYEAQIKLAEATLAAQHAEAAALLSAEGTVVDRQALAKLKSEQARLEEAVARAQYDRVKTKLKILTDAQMSVQTQARLVELTWKTSHIPG